MARNLLEVKTKAHMLAGILCNIKDMGEGVKESENSNSKITWCGVTCIVAWPVQVSCDRASTSDMDSTSDMASTSDM